MIDLSNNNGSVNFSSVREAGQYRVYLKRSEGADFADPTFTGRYKAARDAGMRVGCYHFARPSKFTPKQEAVFFARLAPPLVDRISLRHALDLEDPNITPGPNVAEWAIEFGELVYEYIGDQQLLLYGSPGYLGPCRFPVRPACFAGLWLASYGRNNGIEYPFTTPAPWVPADVLAHQYADTARVPGCNGPVDISRVFSGRIDVDKKKLLGGGGKVDPLG
jgi:lysozyme